MNLKVSISPCPNDTFMFEAMLAGRVDTEGLVFETCFRDIEELNSLAISGGGADISKISYAALPAVSERYVLLDSGSALGRGNGPLLVAAPGVDVSCPGLRVAVPGMSTTGNMLLDMFFPDMTKKTPVLFSDIARAVAEGYFDCGVLIHEGRFTYQEYGLELKADLGKLWEDNSGVPLPLGGIVASRSLPADVARKAERTIRRSVEYAMANPEVSLAFVKEHAAEMSEDVIREHIALFVNEYSVSLADTGRQAVSRLLGMDRSELFLETEIYE